MSDQKSGGIHRSQTSSSAFLLSRSDISEPVAEYGTQSDAAAAWTIETLTRVFPEAIGPGRILEAGLAQVAGADRFAVMAFRIDDFYQAAEPESLIQEAAGIVDEICRDQNGIWGIVDADVLACFLPETDGEACLETADAVREKLAENRNETVTIGIAGYPVLDYDRQSILKNAQKAVVHAEFFGPDSRVVFDSVSLNISGDNYYQAGDIDGAVAEFKKALELDAENINVLNSLGVCYGVREQYDPALECFLEAARLDPEEVMPVYNAGYACMCKGDSERALEYFRQAEALDKNVFEVAFQAGRVYLETGRYIQAKTHLEAAVDLNPGSAAANRYLGDCYMEIDRDADAATAYKNVLKIRPEDAEALSALGYLYEMQSRNADIALMFCQRAVEMAPDNALFRHRLGRLYYNRNRYDEALEEFEAARGLGDTASDEYVSMLQGRGDKAGQC
ncbi:MAG: tetratricopeptide repeat protein [Desulfobacteraceae bacterium]|nr:tetratricopeptide repeat protein [Desulfobacteraceae bacterium]